MSQEAGGNDGKKLVSILDVNPEDAKGFAAAINSPRTLEAARRLGLDLKELNKPVR